MMMISINIIIYNGMTNLKIQLHVSHITVQSAFVFFFCQIHSNGGVTVYNRPHEENA